ncbi:MAG TPA: hypothetical protein VF198_02280 [Vicinamibacterales bacterium]
MDVKSFVNWRRISAIALAAVLAGAASGCSSTVREGRSPAYLIIESLEAASGFEDNEFSMELSSDVVTEGAAFEDLGRARFRLGLRDIGAPGSPTEPTPNNFITVTRYRVKYIRSDGRNVEGVDVPYTFDGAGTATVGPSASTDLVFVLVRAQAKRESPLRELVGGGDARMISTLAEVTFYGRDQVGNEVEAKGLISVNFGDWADPEN